MKFQIWLDDTDGNPICIKKRDLKIARLGPNSVLLHTFEAKTHLEMCEKNADFLGYKKYQPQRDKDGNILEYYLREYPEEEEEENE